MSEQQGAQTGRAVSTKAECNGCDMTAPISELPDGDHDFAAMDTVDHDEYHIEVIHVCGECGCLSATIITSEANLDKYRNMVREEA